MSDTDLFLLLPWLIVAATTVIVMLAAAFYRDSGVALALTVTGLAVALSVLPWVAANAPQTVTPLLLVDRFALFYSAVLLAATLAIAPLSYGYFQTRLLHHEEYYILLLTATLGAMTLMASNHFASFFLGLELLSVALFALLAYPAATGEAIRPPLEAAFKYLILSGVSSAFLVFGMALVYVQSGALTLNQIVTAAETVNASAIIYAGFALILCGIGFKLAVVPFHLWTPDVYQGAPAPVSAYIATVSKGAMLAFLVRVVLTANTPHTETLTVMVGLLATFSILAGNLLALLQQSIKRILAYSSISHLGYMLVPLVAGGRLAGEAIAYYLVGYVLTILGAFAVVSSLSAAKHGLADVDDLGAYQGLFWKQPVPAMILTIMLLSLVGMPLTMGFIGKFYVIAAGVDTHYWWLVLAVVAGSTIGLFYYLRIIAGLYAGSRHEHIRAKPINWPSGTVLVATTLLLVLMGTYPSPLIRLIQETAAVPTSMSAVVALQGR